VVADDKIEAVLTESLQEIDSIIFAYLFGSRAARTHRPTSDVDLAVYLKEGEDAAEEKLTIIGCVTASLQTDNLDVVILNSAPIALTGRILRSRKLLIDRDPFRRHTFESLMLREYMDFSIKETSILNQRFGIGR